MILSSFGPTFLKPFFEMPSQYSSTKVNFNWKKLFVEKNGSMHQYNSICGFLAKIHYQVSIVIL